MQKDQKEESYPRMYLYRRIVQARLFIDKNYASRIDLDNIADEASFSRFHFIRLFKNTYGRSPNNYLQEVRVSHAMRLLRDGAPVNEACFAVGFESHTSFTALFKRHTGLTPSVYKEQQLALKKAVAAAPLNFIPNCFASSKGWNKKSNIEEVA